jgi:flagellar biosynthesis chaperone FliJ
MSQPRRAQRQGRTLHRVRSLQEQVAHLHSSQAEALLRTKADEITRREAALIAHEQATLVQASAGMAAHRFLALQNMHELHKGAVGMAEQARTEAQNSATERRAALHSAVQKRRIAERLVEIATARVALDNRRSEQKRNDDANCVRAARVA